MPISLLNNKTKNKLQKVITKCYTEILTFNMCNLLQHNPSNSDEEQFSKLTNNLTLLTQYAQSHHDCLLQAKLALWQETQRQLQLLSATTDINVKIAIIANIKDKDILKAACQTRASFTFVSSNELARIFTMIIAQEDSELVTWFIASVSNDWNNSKNKKILVVAFKMALKNNNYQIIKLLLQKGYMELDLVANNEDWELFKTVVTSCDDAMLKILLAATFDFRHCLPTFLFKKLQILTKDIVIAKKLLVNGVPANITESIGTSLLMSAITNNNEELVELLLQYGADVNHASYLTKNNNICKLTPLFLAIVSNSPNIVKKLCHYNRGLFARVLYENVYPLIFAIENNKPEIARIIFDYDPISANKILKNRSIKIIIFALSQNKLAILKLLLQINPSMVNSYCPHNNKTALMFAIESGNLAFIRELTATNANVNAITKTQTTVLMTAILFCPYEQLLRLILPILKFYGADFTYINDKGISPYLCVFNIPTARNKEVALEFFAKKILILILLVKLVKRY